MASRYKAELGRAIKRRREGLGLTQKDLAERTHYKEAQTVSRWERGENVPGDLEVVAHALEWTLGEMLAGIEAPDRRTARRLGFMQDPDEPADVLARLTAIESQLADIHRALLGTVRTDGDAEIAGEAGVVAEVVARLEESAGSPPKKAHGRSRNPPATRVRKSA